MYQQSSGDRRARPPLASGAGQSLTELALVLPVLVLIFIGILDLGRAFHTQVAAANAASVGVIYAQPLLDPQGPTRCGQGQCNLITVDDIITKTVNEAQGSVSITPADVRVCLSGDPCPTAGRQTLTHDQTITVTVTVPFTPITPLVHLPSISGAVTGRIFPP